jgi:Flp pilus assembly protein TadG
MKRKQKFSGQTLIEFALVIPWALLLIMGFFDLGRAIFYYSSLSNAVRAGARSGIILNFDDFEGDKAKIKTTVEDYSFGIPTSDIDITVDPIKEDETDKFYVTLNVVAKYCFNPVTPFISSIVDNCEDGSKGIQLNAESVMRFEPMIDYE